MQIKKNSSHSTNDSFQEKKHIHPPPKKKAHPQTKKE